ncbi:coenzyme F420-0:L-glutamate ligase [Natranaerobius trueperi]|uniref:F420-0:Gamma-glutamyl ligase n=1 Tax=Natranaerobius trueperi TaxID=759412 RepID=A0A226C0X1_9FIRM|nr:coenzyme F420-0:L-glutamate ligase [Natranaerobius trueperi]OWZ84876.1 F420-0:Gamma-glutamyl ligase [Natranaerobius trueperi]
MNKIKLIPIRTHLITNKDDIVEVIENYTKKIVTDKDVICIAESVLAISQGRYFKPSKINPSILSRTLCHYTKRDGNLTNPASMELAAKEVGKVRLLLGAILGGAGKLLLKKDGVFYQLAGSEVARIDDVARTMHPFDHYIVLGPKEPEKVSKQIAEKTNASCAIVDVNDLGFVDVLGASSGLDKDKLEELLKTNPFGNDDQNTPITIIKNYFSH